ncbi:MAG: YwqG family protein [Leptolyngbya sp. Prado105]|nr:YwqG family protein [Leptolyngbya sp. Prado105]
MTIATTDTPQFLQDLPPQFEPLRSFLEANLVPYIKFTAISAGHLNSAGYGGSDWGSDPLELWQSKIGGHPYLPKGTSYPTDAETGGMMMFLMQVNCGDLPMIESLNLPRQGLLQFYIGLDVPMSVLSPEQHRVLYYPNVSQDKNDLITDFSFLAEPARSLEWYDGVYALSFSAQRDLFWNARQQLDDSFEVPEHLIELCEDFDEWILAYEEEATFNRQRINKLGGYPELHSDVEETIEGAKGHLLLELQHEFNSDDNFYFYIEAPDLASLSFNSIESYFVRV